MLVLEGIVVLSTNSDTLQTHCGATQLPTVCCMRHQIDKQGCQIFVHAIYLVFSENSAV